MQKVIERQQQAAAIRALGFEKLGNMLQYWHLRKLTPDELDRTDGKKS